jgi:hypothetical protein
MLSGQPAPAQNTLDYFGRTDSASIPSSGMKADFKRASKAVLSASGTMESLCGYLDGLGGVSGEQKLRFVLYKDVNGVPGEKVLQAADLVVQSGAPPKFYCGGTDALPVDPGTYWIALQSGGDGGVARYYYDGAANWYGNADTFADGAANTFGPGNAGGGTPTFYGRYFVSSVLAHAGRSSIGTLPSKGLTANYKRASSFNLTQPGRLERLSFYVDGNGGVIGSGGQDGRMVLYRDAGGVPGAKVTEGPQFAIAVGSSPRWIQHYVSPLVLTPGRYWIGLQTGITGGVMRDFADGPANWYANNDVYADGATDPFGVGTTGTVTMSAFMSYIPGNFRTTTFGRTSVGVPSSGLTADMKRGSFFALPTTDAVATALYAYLDGNGGEPGSQSARMVLYYADAQQQPGEKLVESDIVNLSAGTPPGWVRFAIPPTRLDSGVTGLFLVIHTGGDAGVIRDYGGGSARNWIGATDTFSDGATPMFGAGTSGVGTLSVYAEYTTRQ